MAALAPFIAGRTTLVITHRPASLPRWTGPSAEAGRIVEAVAPAAAARRAPPRPIRLGQRRRDHGLRLLDDPLEVLLAAEALGVDLVDVLGARTAGRRTSPARS